MTDYLDPVVVRIVGDDTGLLETLTRDQGALTQFAASAPEVGQLQPEHAANSAMEVAGAVQAASAAAVIANAPVAEDFAPMIAAAGDAGSQAGLLLGRNLTEAEVAALSDQDFDRLMEHLQTTAGDAGTRAGSMFQSNFSNASAAGGGGAMQARWDGWAREAAAAEEAATSIRAEGEAEQEAGRQADEAGKKAADARVHWMALGLGFGAMTAGPMLLSTAIVGTGYEIAKMGGEAQGQLQIVEEAFRTSAAQAAQSYEPAIHNITQSLATEARAVEPQMAQMFTELSGPAQDFFHGLESSVDQGMQAMVPAVAQIGPVIASVASDLGPLFAGLATAAGDMSQAFTAAGGNEELGQLAAGIGELLPPVGQLVGEASGGLLPVLTSVADILHVVSDVLGVIPGPVVEFAVAGIAITRAWGPIEGLIAKGIAGVDSLSASMKASVGASEAATAATEAQGAAAATTAMETEALAGSVAAEGAAAELSVAGSEAAATGITSIGLAAIEVAAELATFLLELAPLLAIGYVGWKIGEAIGSGISGGMDSSSPEVTQSAYQLGGAVQSGFAGSLEIASPSRVMAAHGQDAAAGVAVGLTAGTPLATSASAAMAAGMVTAFNTGVSGGGPASGGGSAGGGFAGGGGSTTITINVQVPLASATAQEIADAILPAIQQININNGQSMTSHTGLKGVGR